MYKLLYYSNYKSLEDNNIRIEIYKDTEDNIESKELVLSSDSVTIEYTSDTIFKTLKQSSCTVNVLTKTILSNLYTGKLNEILIKIFKNNELFWFGYETQNVYTTDFSDETNKLSLEFIDTVAQLDNVKYKNIDTTNNKSEIRSFYEIINKILNIIDPEKVISNIYVSKSFSVNNTFDLLNNLYIQEKNFFDEENEAQTCKEVIEDIIKFLGMSLIQFKDSYYIIDYECLKNGNNDFYHYNRNDYSNDGIITLSSDVRNLSQIGIYESNASISLENVYNKINLISNSNKISTPIPELFDDLVNQNTDTNYYEIYSGTTYTYFLAWFNSKQNWTTKPTMTNLYDSIPIISKSNMGTIGLGSFFQKNDSFKNTEDEPTSLNWTNYLTMCNSQLPLFADDKPKDSFLYVNKYEDIIYKGGYLILNMDYKLSNTVIADDNLDVTGTTVNYSNSKYSAGIYPTKFACRLKIGDYYYNGEEWTQYSAYTNNLTYYSQITATEVINGVKKFYISNIDNSKTYISETEYNKINLKDKFWVIHTNKNGDSILNDWKTLDNKVSYKMNLVDASEGVAIPVPSNMILQGRLEFELSCPDTLGLEQCYQSNLETNATLARYCHIKDLSLSYTNSKYKVDIFNSEDLDTDTKYTNVINEDFITDLDDITLKVNTFTSKCSSYSNVIIKNDNKYDYLNTIHSVAENVDVIQEQNIINKYYNYYSTPKFIYSNNINNDNITPLSIISVNEVSNNMLIDSLSYDLNNDSVSVKLTQF